MVQLWAHLYLNGLKQLWRVCQCVSCRLTEAYFAVSGHIGTGSDICFCGGTAKLCKTNVAKLLRTDKLNVSLLVSASLLPTKEINESLPHSDCSHSLMNNSNCFTWSKENENILTANGEVLKRQGIGTMKLKMDDMNLKATFLVVNNKFLGFNFILRMDIIKNLDGVWITNSDKAISHNRSCQYMQSLTNLTLVLNLIKTKKSGQQPRNGQMVTC